MPQADKPIEAKAKALPQKTFQKKLVAIMPNLRAFAYRLCGRADLADDLTQEAMQKAWAARDKFKPDRSLKAWTFTILRNVYLSQMRRRKFKGDYDEVAAENILSIPPDQRDPMHLTDVQRAMTELPDDQRKALLLVGVSGLSYEEAGDICECAPGTVKSRVSRARTTLKNIFEDGKMKVSRTVTSNALNVTDDFLSAANALAAKKGAHIGIT